ncbi:hypothetical protein FZO89_09485 [Luteimonas viscosa]|uniref:Uncharacterized protein n=1 Tax=Luteimonas viscosa TaxID=1132694 RepID=A0A5D4XPF7_9GAMM|nr:hypothetical protein [Luteimonas viscosa]TYT26469.1 hypothetical protein FZO89_09485 [Luteimonas viscosa]
MRNFIALVVFSLVASPAYACGCSKPRTPEEVRDQLVFKGRVASATKNSGHGRGFYVENGTLFLDVATRTIVFDVIEQLRGPKRERVTVNFNEGGSTSCDLEDLSFESGDLYLISVYAPDISGRKDRPNEQFSNNFCNLRERI